MSAGGFLTEVLFDILFLALFSICGLIFFPDTGATIIVVFILVCTVLMLFAVPCINLKLPVLENINQRIDNLLLSLRSLSKSKLLFIKILFYSFCWSFLTIIHTLIFFRAIGIQISLLPAFAIIPVAIFTGMIPVTLGGMGTRDTAFILLFSQFGTNAQLLGVGMLFSFFRYWLPAIIGLPFMSGLLNREAVR